ncbi:hypothetical protein [Tenacibaculum halocynthiae]|uniref:hypothetical protein n=1 Tax=Tenacibaculum halocynthiae TaxID=1254437 RepID=UPI003D65CC98
MFSVFGTNGYKISTIATIIPILESGRGDAVFIFEFVHFMVIVLTGIGGDWYWWRRY